MSHTVIDLGEVPDHRGTPAETPVRRPPVPYRALLGALSAVLLALPAGAANQRAPLAPTVIPARLGDTFVIDGDPMYLIGSGWSAAWSTPRSGCGGFGSLLLRPLHIWSGRLMPCGGNGGRAVRVLVVEDERNLCDAIARGLRRKGMAVDVAYDGLQGHEMAYVTRYDVVVLDRDLPGKHGDEICADLVASGALTRVLMLTASGTVADRVEGLQLGADDYLAKPFAFEELVARVQALGRRATPAAPPVLTVGNLILDQTRRVVTRGGVPIELTNKEFGVLEELLKARGGVVSSEELLERVWDANTDPFTTTVRVTVMTLRKKVGDPPLIETVVGAGYRVPEPVGLS